MKNQLFCLELPVILFFLLLGAAGAGAQPVKAPVPDTADYPYWIRMMQDPDANYFATVSAFNRYWKNRPVTKSCGWKVFKRWEYIMGGRIAPDGTRPKLDAVYNEWKQFSKRALSPGGAWVSLGPAAIPAPGPAGYEGLGRLNVVGFHPADGNRIYAGSPSGGFWMSSDYGATWSTTTDNMPTIGVSSIVVDYSSPSVILIGTGDRDAGDAPGMGVFRSADGGMTWSPWNNGMGNVTVGRLIQHPSNPLILLAATSGGVYRSVNGGSTWTQTHTGYFHDICFKPGNPDIVYAESSSNFFRSVNNGTTFTQITSGLTTGQRGAIAVTPANPEYVYFLQSDNSSGFKGVYLSTDAGQHFTTQSTTPNILDWSCDGSGTGGQGWYDLAIAADPDNEETVYVGGVDVWKSANGGRTWTINSHWYGGCGVPAAHADCHFLGFSAVNGRLYAGNDGGIYWTDDGGANWTDCTVGMTIGQIYRIGQSQTDAAKTINGFQDNGSYTLTASGWVATGGGDGMECAVDYLDASVTYHTVYYGSIYRKINNANEKQIAGQGVFGIDESGGWITPFILDETDPKTMFVGYKNVWRCPDVSLVTPVWTKISTGETSECSVVEQSPVNPEMIYVVRWNSMKRTENAFGGTPAWTTCSLPGGYTPTDLEAHPADLNTVYATAGNKVYKSTDKGMTWNLVPGTMPNVPANAIVYDVNSNEGLYVGTQTGVLYRDANTAGWVNFSSGFPVVDVRELEIFYSPNPANNRLMAATYGRGLWKSDLYYPPSSPPVPNFSYSPGQSCTSQTVQFTDLSLNSPTAWLWSFTPPTVTFVNSTGPASRNPQVQFAENITYHVNLTATNANGSRSTDTLVMIGGNAPPLTGSFESGTFPDGWSISNPDGGITWTIATTGGASSGTKSAYIDFYDYYPGGTTDDLILPSVNLKGALNPWLKFRVAYRRWGEGYSDGLKIFVSTDCGATWETGPLYDKSGTSLATGPDQSDPFVPTTPSDWRLDSVYLGDYHDMSVKIRFQGVNGWGNNLFIDDITLAEDPLLMVGSETVGNGQTNCYNATGTIRVAGGGDTFRVAAGGSATFIAGKNIQFLYGTKADYGAYLFGRITTTGSYCGQMPPAMVTTGIEEPLPPPAGNSAFRIYPNPNNGGFTLEWLIPGVDAYTIEIYGTLGEKKLTELKGSSRCQFFTVSFLPPGIYFLKVTGGKGSGIAKMIRLQGL